MIENACIRLEAHLDEVVRLNTWLEAASKRAGLDPTTASDLKLCLNEIIANLLSYSFKDTAHPILIIELGLEPRIAKAAIWDNGGYFDIRDWPQPKKPSDLMSASIGGYGIHLVRERARSIDYRRVGEFNRLELVCSPEAPGTAAPGT